MAATGDSQPPRGTPFGSFLQGNAPPPTHTPVGGGVFRWRTTMEKSLEKDPYLRELLTVIENDMLEKLGREPDRIDRNLIYEIAKLALGIRYDAVRGVSDAWTWEAEELLHEGLYALGLHRVMTVASKSLEYTAAGRA
jgi:hypothetical protein